VKRAIITGITGQDGSYLAELLLSKGYTVYGIVRRSSTPNLSRIQHICGDESFSKRLKLLEGDLGDAFSLQRACDIAEPDEIYNLAAMSDVKISFNIPEYTSQVNSLGTIRFLEIVRAYYPQTKFYQASTSELFGKVREIPQSENTPFYPRSPYGVSKLCAYWAVVNYREAYNLFACNGILFNHESPRRGENFVSRKITLGAAKIKVGLQDKLVLGNLDAKRDWGYAKDFVEGMWQMLQHKSAEDFVLATGKTTTVRRFVELSFKELDIEIEWTGQGLQEKGINRTNGEVVVEVSSEMFRPAEVDILLGNPAKAKQQLGWAPSTSVEELVHLMIHSDLEIVTQGSTLLNAMK
jgi:GDPmannose 4,6-dehydratase